MSLLKQLMLSVSLAMGGILLGTLVFSIEAARHYLNEQLESQSENAVSALALTLSQASNQDPVTRELLLSALYDSGQFSSITLQAADGEMLFASSQLQPVVRPDSERAPAWFARLLPLAQHASSRAVSNGWQQVGTVTVVVDQRSANAMLWMSSLKLTTLIVAAGLVWALFVGYLLRWLQRVLREEIAAQVLHIGRQPETQVHAKARPVAELAEVSRAIEQTHVRVQQTEQAHNERIESLVLETHRDVVTQLPNRKFFLNELRRHLQKPSGELPDGGHVLLCRQRDLQAMNSSMPRSEVDAWLQALAAQVQTLLSEQMGPGAIWARLNGSDFALLLPQASSPAAMHAVQAVRTLLQSLNVGLAEGRRSRWAFALTAYGAQDTAGDVLARLDQGLMHAELAGHGDVEYAESARGQGRALTTGVGQWQTVLATALRVPEQLALAVQTHTHASLMGTEVRHEAALELHEAQGQVLGAALFLPAVVRLGLSADYDLRAVQLGLDWLAAHPGPALVVRISQPSLEHESLLAQLQTLLRAAPSALVQRLVLEIDAFALVASPTVAADFCTSVQAVGAAVGLRRLDQSPMALLHLPGLGLRYVKLGGYLAEQSLHNSGVRHLLEAMITTAKEQGCAVYVSDMVATPAADWLRLQGASLLVSTQ